MNSKAIRDNIKVDGTVIELDNKVFLDAMIEKLQEEVAEVRLARRFKDGNIIEELGDMIDVCYRLAELYGIDNEALNEIRRKKYMEKGGFYKNRFWVG